MRECVGMLDLGGFTKLIVEGAGRRSLARAASSAAACPASAVSIAPTLTLNAKGGILKANYTITRVAPERFLPLISAAAAEWLRSGWAVTNICLLALRCGSRMSPRATARGSWPARAREALARVIEAGSLQRRLPLAERARDRDRLCEDAGPARQLCRGARLGIARADRAHGRRPRRRCGGRARSSASATSACTRWILAAGARLSRLEGRSHSRISVPADGGARPSSLRSTSRGFHRQCGAFRGKRGRDRGRRLVTLVLDEAGEADSIPLPRRSSADGAIVGLTVSAGYGHALGKAIALGRCAKRPRRGGDDVGGGGAGATRRGAGGSGAAV